MRQIVCLVFVMSVVAGRAAAQSNAVAEQLFNEGRTLAKDGKWQEACPKFEASLRLDPALGTRLNLATCYTNVGKLASAWALYRESMELAKKAGDMARSDYAKAQATALEPRLPKLVITAPPTIPTGLSVRRDDVVLNPAELGLGLYVDPGPHEITATAPGFEPFTQKVTVQEGKTETLAIPALTAKPVSEETPEEEETVVETVPASPTRKYIGLGVAGAGVVGVVVGFVFGSQAISKNNEAKDLCGDELMCSPANFEKGKQLVEDGRSKATLSTVFVIGGVAAIAGGAVLYFTAPRGGERRTARVVPTVDGSGGGVAVVGSF